MITLTKYNEIKDNYKEKLQAGYYECVILNAEETISQSGDPMIKVLLDIAEGDHKDYYRRRYQENNNPNKFWECSYSITFKETNKAFIKGILTALEKSNSNYKVNVSNNGDAIIDAKDLVGKRIGVEFHLKEYEGNDGKIYTKVYPRFLRSIGNKDFNITVLLLNKEIVSYEEYKKRDEQPSLGQTFNVEDKELPFI